jgi:PTS system beta-glucosides-specific IIC component
MAVKIDAAETAEKLVALVGGAENVLNTAHCMTRLRFTLKDQTKANLEEIKTIRGVLGVVVAGGQTQIVLGENLLTVYSEVLKQNHFKEEAVIEENLDQPKQKGFKAGLNAVLGYISGCVTPAIPALVAGGMLKVVLLLIGLVSADFAASQANMILGWIANAPFYFLPIFVAYGGTKKLNATPAYAMLVTAALLTPKWAELVAAGDAVSMFGIPVKLVTYSSSLLPALLIALAAAYLERFFNKIIPGIFRSLLVGLLTITVTGILAFTILGPAGSYVGAVISKFFLFVGNTVPWLGVGLLAGCLPWLVMTGMHMALAPFMASNIADIGYDAVIRPAFLLHNMAEGGACIGVGLRAKDPEFKSEAFSIGFGAIVAGVSEPAIYGINLKLKKPMYGVMAGGAAGGIVAGLLGAKAYVMGYSTIMALPIFMDTIFAMAVGIVVCIAVSAAVTYILGFDQNEAHV